MQTAGPRENSESIQRNYFFLYAFLRIWGQWREWLKKVDWAERHDQVYKYFYWIFNRGLASRYMKTILSLHRDLAGSIKKMITLSFNNGTLVVSLNLTERHILPSYSKVLNILKLYTYSIHTPASLNSSSSSFFFFFWFSSLFLLHQQVCWDTKKSSHMKTKVSRWGKLGIIFQVINEIFHLQRNKSRFL